MWQIHSYYGIVLFVVTLIATKLRFTELTRKQYDLILIGFSVFGIMCAIILNKMIQFKGEK